MPEASVRVGIVGLGLAATAHISGYRSHPRAEVVAVCDLDWERAVGFAERYGIGRVYTDYADLLVDPEVDLVDLATPTYLHAEMTEGAARAGKHIHCEKPFCRSLAEGERAWRAVQQAGVKLLVGETYVFLTAHRTARELLAAGEIGRPLQMRQRHGAWYRRPDAALHLDAAARSWRLDPIASGGGAYPWVFDHAVHFFATAEYPMLDSRVAEVYAVAAGASPESNVRSGAAHDPYRSDAEDVPIITWRYADADRQGVWMRAERLNGKYDYMHGFSTTIAGSEGMIQVLGEGGHNLLWNGEQQHLILHRSGKEPCCFRFDEPEDEQWESEISYYGRGHHNQVHHLIDCILQDRAPFYTGADGLRAVCATLATIRSAQLGRPVRLEEVEDSYTAYDQEGHAREFRTT